MTLYFEFNVYNTEKKHNVINFRIKRKKDIALVYIGV